MDEEVGLRGRVAPNGGRVRNDHIGAPDVPARRQAKTSTSACDRRSRHAALLVETEVKPERVVVTDHLGQLALR
jgi:hypothetical protein